MREISRCYKLYEAKEKHKNFIVSTHFADDVTRSLRLKFKQSFPISQ